MHEYSKPILGLTSIRSARYLKLIDEYERELAKSGYNCKVVRQHLHSIAHLGVWLPIAGVALEAVDEDAVVAFDQYRPVCECPGTSRDRGRHVVSCVRVFVRYLRERGVVQIVGAHPAVPGALVGEFCRWLRANRGVVATTLSSYQQYVADLVDCLGADPGAYSARGLRSFVATRYRHYQCNSIRMVLAAIRPRAGAVAFVQRFDSGLRLNVQLHVLWLDGVYSHEPGRSGVEWCEQAQVTDADVAQIVRRVRDRVRRKLRQMGKWPDAGDAADADALPDASDGEQLLLALDSAAVQGVAASGERAGQRDVRVGRGTRDEPNVLGPLCADFDGFSLHAAVRAAAGNRRQLEHLCRYAGRPAIAESRLSLLPDGRVCYALKKKWRDGTTAVVLEPGVLIERLLALVPRPRRHLVTYHGVLAPAASLRSRIVPRVDEEEEAVGADGQRGDECAPVEAGIEDSGESRARRARVPHRPGKRRMGGRRYYTWAELLRRVYSVDVFTCPRCGGARRLLAAIQDPASIERVLRAMGLPCDAPELAPARAPPGGEQGWFGA